MKLLPLLALVVAFFAGMLVDAWWRAGRAGGVVDQTAASSALDAAKYSVGNPVDGPASRGPKAASPSAAKGYRVDAQTIEALLAGGGPQRMLLRMGFNDRELQAIEATRAKGVAALKDLEKAHAKVVRNEQGEYVEILPFQDERTRWLAGLESELGAAVGQDRAPIVARMIAFSDNDQDVGMHRREVHVGPPATEGGKVRIEEKSFDSAGRHVDSDYEVVDSGSKSRWGHVLDFDGE